MTNNFGGFRKIDVDRIKRSAERARTSRQHGRGVPWACSPDAFIPIATPKMRGRKTQKPRHLNQVTLALKACDRGEPIRRCFSVPPQHGKTQLLIHGMVWYALRHAGHKCLYASYSSQRAGSLSDDIRAILRNVGQVDLERDTREEVRLSNGSVIHLRGLNGPILGEGYDMIIVDDPHKSWAEAASPVLSKAVYDNFITTVESRIDPQRTGIIVVHQRLSRSDLIGRLTQNEAYTHTNIPARNEDGTPLWPERFPDEALTRIEKGNADRWTTLYMGVPASDLISTFKVDGISVKDPPDEIRRHGRRCYGIDVGATGRGDRSAIVELLRDGDDYYIIRAWQGLMSAEDFASMIKQWTEVRPAPVWWHGGGQESAVANTYRKYHGLNVHFQATNVSKATRAMGAAVSWNSQHVHLPSMQTQGTDDLVNCLTAFSGDPKDADDIVDALSSAWTGLQDNPRQSVSAQLRWASGKLPRSEWS